MKVLLIYTDFRLNVARLWSALTVAARIALAAAFLVDEAGLAAFGAQVADLQHGLRKRPGHVGVAQVAAVAIALVRIRLLRAVLQAFAALLQILFEHLGDAVGEGTHAVRAKAQRAAAADAGELADDFLQPFGRLDGRGHAQDVGDQAAGGFGDRGGVGAGLGRVDEDLEGLRAAVFIDGHKGLAERRLHRVGEAGQIARARFLGFVP